MEIQVSFKNLNNLIYEYFLIRIALIYNWYYLVDVFKVLQTISPIYTGEWLIQIRSASTITNCYQITNTK